MRGLGSRHDGEDDRPGDGPACGTHAAASTTALAGLVAVGLLLAGCSTGGTGSRDEGAARADDVTPTAPAASPSSTATSPASAVVLAAAWVPHAGPSPGRSSSPSCLEPRPRTGPAPVPPPRACSRPSASTRSRC
ncbi:hypothetical protein EAO71_20895 [Streptomyces sp. ms191]|nr:hypothetical protein EAO71_20895 [Streptomyces sp. ms191]